MDKNLLSLIMFIREVFFFLNAFQIYSVNTNYELKWRGKQNKTKQLLAYQPRECIEGQMK